jgi:hypothetical protein
MYSAIVNDSGISQHTMELIVLAAIGIFILGLVFYLWWKQIMIGALALGAVVVMANHKPKAPVVPKVEQEQIIIEKPIIIEKIIEKPIEVPHTEVKPVEPTEVKPVEPKEELLTKPEDDRKYFIEDCLSYTDYNTKHCEYIWDKREVGDQKLLDVENVAYKKRRAAALKKPGTFVTHYTLQDRK